MFKQKCVVLSVMLLNVKLICTVGLDGMTDWVTTDIEVRVRHTHDDHTLINKSGVIRSMSVSAFLISSFCNGLFVRILSLTLYEEIAV